MSSYLRVQGEIVIGVDYDQGHGLVGIPLVLIFHGDLMGILWDLTTQYITI